MANKGSQQFWIVGARLWLRRKGATNDAYIDLGTITQIAPNFTTDKITIEDPQTGVKNVVFERVSKFTESYDLTCSNFNTDNLALVFSADDAESFQQAVAAPNFVSHVVKDDRIHKVHDTDGVNVYNLSSIVLCNNAKKFNITAVAAGKFTIAGDHTADFGAGVKFTVAGNATLAANGSYTSTGAALAGGDTEISVANINGATATGALAVEYVLDTDYEITDLEKGMFRQLSAGAIADAATVAVAYKTAAITDGLRLVHPQTSGGTIEGDALIFFERDGGEEQSVRECEVSVSTGNTNLTADAGSDHVITVTVLADRTNATSPAGRLLQFKGDLPDVS